MLKKLKGWLAGWRKHRELAELTVELRTLAKLPEGVADARIRRIETRIAELTRPRFVFCSGGDRDALGADNGDRRFMVVDIDSPLQFVPTPAGGAHIYGFGQIQGGKREVPEVTLDLRGIK
jgi:hypothetical protein